MEATAAAYISDVIVSFETKIALRSAVAPLEDVSDDQKDWHPGSDGKVLDLVHPSLFPLMYGKSKYLAIGKVLCEIAPVALAKGTQSLFRLFLSMTLTTLRSTNGYHVKS